MTNAFERHGLTHLSASQVNTWINAPSFWLLEKLLGFKGQMGCAAHRGTSVETGVSLGLFDQSMSLEACVEPALAQYGKLTALSGDARREQERAGIPGMVEQGLALRSHGIPVRPNSYQHKVEIRLEGVSVPVIGYLDWLHADEVIDLKTTFRVPSAMSEPHLRQASIYKTAHMDKRVRFFYVSDKKSAKHTLTRDQYDRAMRELTQAAQRLERFLGLSDDAQELASIIPHSSETFYWGDPVAKSRAIEIYGF
jgi:hypothetical protein